jgi:hypothetical protein
MRMHRGTSLHWLMHCRVTGVVRVSQSDTRACQPEVLLEMRGHRAVRLWTHDRLVPLDGVLLCHDANVEGWEQWGACAGGQCRCACLCENFEILGTMYDSKQQNSHFLRTTGRIIIHTRAENVWWVLSCCLRAPSSAHGLLQRVVLICGEVVATRVSHHYALHCTCGGRC